jgi:hypothetical protein
VRLLPVVLALLAPAAPAAAAPPDDLSADPLDRATLLALPSVYRVDTTIHVTALETRDGTRIPLPPAARSIPESGTAFAAAASGWLVTAAHVVAPSDETIARLAYQQHQIDARRPHSDEDARAWVESNGARPVGVRVDLRVRPADAGPPGGPAAEYVPEGVRLGDEADLALLRIDAPAAPALELDEAASLGTPVVSLGFGRGSGFAAPTRADLEPAVRRGELGRTGTLEGVRPHQAIVVTLGVQAGDSGAPVVDAQGRVRGVVVQRRPENGIAETATEVRQLLEDAGVEARPGRSAELFRAAMAAFWALDLPTAERGFEATLTEFGGHTLARRELARAAALSRATFRLEGDGRLRGLLLALGTSAVVGALLCGLGLARPHLPGWPPAGRTRTPPGPGG